MKIIILNGASRKNGNTTELVNAFIEGAENKGHEIHLFRLDEMNISGCKGCLKGTNDPEHPCVQTDDMDKIYKKFKTADLIVFASPLYFWTITGPLKTVADRLYAELECLGYSGFEKESILLMTADGGDYSQALNWYRTYERNLGWRNRGEVLGKRRTKEAYTLGASL